MIKTLREDVMPFLLCVKNHTQAEINLLMFQDFYFWFQNFFLTYFRPSDTVFLVFEWETLY